MNKWIQQEQEVLTKTIEQIEKKQYMVVSGSDVEGEKLTSTTSRDGTLNLQRENGDNRQQVELAIEEPYFGRIDIEENRSRDTMYIGKRGIKDKEENVIVVDWRRPIASVFYNFTPDQPRQTYKITDANGEYTKTVDVLKKRQFTIEKQKIKSIQQEGPSTKSELNKIITAEGSQKSNRETVLHSELEKSSTNGYLKEIIATIQTEQNKAIRKPLDRNVIIQGVAGSGKSSIALHRMSYLLYNHSIKPENMLIVAPSELFLSSIQNLLPNLELNGINQSTFESLAIDSLKTINIHLKHKSLTHFFESMIYAGMSDDEFLFAKLRSSEQMILWIDEFVDTIKDRAIAGIKPFKWNHFIVSAEEMKTTFKGYAYLPLDRQLKSFRDTMLKQFKELYQKEKKDIESFDTGIRSNYFRNHNLSHDETETLVTLLNKLRDSKYQVLNESFELAVETWRKSIEQVNLLDLYHDMWKQIQLVYSSDEEVMRLLLVNHDELDYFDTAPLFYLALKLGHQFKNYTHIVVDEAQDLSYVQIRCLKAMTKTMTIIGDTNQSLLMDCGQINWKNVITSIYRPSTIDFLELSKSYRSTAEIIEVAKGVLATEFPKESQKLYSVNRSGAPVIWAKVDSGVGMLEHMIAILTNWKSLHKRICIIAKDSNRASRLVPLLKQSFPDVKLITHTDEVVGEGIFVMAAHEVKGMEFDAIYLMNVDDTNYPQTKFYAKLLYTLLTRAQQELAISYHKTPSPLIQEFTLPGGKQLEMLEEIL